MLLHQNRQMANRLEELRDEKRVAEAHIQRLDGQQRDFDTHLAAIDRHWLGLDEDLRGVLARADVAAAPPAAAEAAPASADAADAPHRFLQRLLQKELPAGVVEETAISQELKKRCTFTANVLQQVAAGLAAKEEASPAGEKELRAQLDTWQAKATEAGAQAAALDGQLALGKQQLQELTKRMESAEDELEVAKREVKKATFNLQDAKKAAAAGGGGQPAAAAAAPSAAGGASGGDANSDLRVQEAEEALKDAETTAAARLTDSEELRELLIKAEQETVKIKQQLMEPQEIVILRQPTYQCLAFEHAELDKSHTKLQDDYQQLQREMEASTASSQSSASKLGAASSAARNELLSKLQETQKELLGIRTRYDEVQESMKRQASQPDRAAQVTELNKLVSALRTQLEKQKEEIKSRPRTSETAAIQQDLQVREAALTKQLKDNETKRSSLLAGKKKAEAALAEALKSAKKKEKELVAKADELQIINNVLQSSNKEPRELTELRSSEKTLASRLETATAENTEVTKECEIMRAKAAEAEKTRDDAIANASKAAEKAIAEGGGGTAADMDALRQKLSKAISLQKMQKEEEEGLVQELDEIGQAFEEMQTQNAKLLAQLQEKDDENFRLMSSRVKDTSKQTVLEDAGRARDIKLQALESKLSAQAEALAKVSASESHAQEEIKKLKAENEAARQLAEQCRSTAAASNEKLVELRTIFEIADKQRKELQTVSETVIEEKNKAAGRAAKLET